MTADGVSVITNISNN